MKRLRSVTGLVLVTPNVVKDVNDKVVELGQDLVKDLGLFDIRAVSVCPLTTGGPYGSILINIIAEQK